MNLEIYSKDWCPYCKRAKALLEGEKIGYTEIDVTTDFEREEEMIQRSGGRRTVPQIFVEGRLIGGYDDLAALNRRGPLVDVLQTSQAQTDGV